MNEMMARSDAASLLLQQLQKHWATTTDPDQTLSMLMIGLDDYKRFCQVYGQQTVKECLQSMTGILRNNLRSESDIAIHYAEDCFCVVLPQTAPVNARLVAERLRTTVSSLRLRPVIGLMLSDPVTVSCGVASVGACDQLQPEKLIKLADNALHLAKVAGCNRTVSMASQLH